MRFLIGFIFILLPTILLAGHTAQINCYSSGKLIYSGYGKDFAYEDGIFAFKESNSNKIVFSTGDCVIHASA